MSRGLGVERYWPQVFLSGAGSVAAGVLLAKGGAGTPGWEYWPWLVIVGFVVAAVPVSSWCRKHLGSRGRVRRWSLWSSRNDGVASPWQIYQVAGRHAMRKKATVFRPSLRQLGFVRRLSVRTREYATPLARVGVQRVWSPAEDVTIRLGGPRTGKSGEMACRILDAPGAVIATSTRTDLIELTRERRSRKGPVYVFNPNGLGGLASTIKFDPVLGCEVPATATARAEDLLSAVSAPGSGGDREFWASQARRVLASLMHAAALGELTMRDVQAWVADPESAANEVVPLLRRSPEPAYEADAMQFLNTNDRTRSSISATIMPALGWLTNSTAAAAARLGPGESVFDVAKLLDESGTVYMLGAEDGQTAPLVSALTGYIAREARRIASEQPSGRLDPSLTMGLDEAAVICPIPLDNWTADMGGRNVTIHIAAQSRAQLRQRWGDAGAAAILNNSATILIFGGTKDESDLNAYATLIGDRDEAVPTRNKDGEVVSVSYRKVPVLTPAQIAQLPARRVVIIRREMRSAIGVAQMAWRRWDIRLDAFLARWTKKRDDERAVVQLFADDTPPTSTRLRAVADPDEDSEGDVA